MDNEPIDQTDPRAAMAEVGNEILSGIILRGDKVPPPDGVVNISDGYWIIDGYYCTTDIKDRYVAFVKNFKTK